MKSLIFYRFVVIFCIANICVLGCTNAQTTTDTKTSAEIKAYLKEVTAIVKAKSAFSDRLDWPTITKELERQADTMTSMAYAPQLTKHLISKLKAVGDKHSFLMNKVTSQRYAKGNIVGEKPRSKLLPGNIGYIYVPGLGSTNAETTKQFAMAIQNMIKQLETNNDIKGWVVDLRENYGGNMYPMIAGVGPLTGDGKLGYFVGKFNGKTYNTPWYYIKGAAGAGNGTYIRVEAPYQLKNNKTRIAVLISKATSSSGEMTAISFWGAKNAKFFGQPSGGYVTANEPVLLRDGSTLHVATSYTASRNKKTFTDEIIPDVIVDATKGADDAVLEVASKWLLGAK